MTFMYKIIFAVLIICGIGIYYWFTQKKIETLTASISKYEVAVKQSEATINQLQVDAEENQKQITELSNSLAKAEVYNDELRQTLRKHNLERLAVKKPGLIEKRINDASKKLIDDIIADTVSN